MIAVAGTAGGGRAPWLVLARRCGTAATGCVALLALLALAPAGAFAVNAPPAGPAPDPLISTLATVEDLLARFEETATGYHVLLVNDPAARREGALRLSRLGLHAAQQGQTKLAARCLGWAVSFPGMWWYKQSLPTHQIAVVMAALEACEQECKARTACSSGAQRDEHASEWDALVRRAARRPFIPPNQTAALPSGDFETVLDFTHYPREAFAVSVDLDGVAVGGGQVRPDAAVLRVRPALGTYRVTAHLSTGPVSHEYRATALTCGPAGLTLNGAPYVVKACRLTDITQATKESARATLERLSERGFNLGIVQTPPRWLLDLADELSFGIAVEPSLSGPDGVCALCCGDTGVSGLQDRVAAHVRRYAEAPAVRMWMSAAPLEGDAEIVLDAIYALYRQLDLYERPVLYLGALDGSSTARDAVFASLDGLQDSPARAARIAEARAEAQAQELPCLSVSSGPLTEAAEAAWREAITQGCAGGVVGTVSLAKANGALQ